MTGNGEVCIPVPEKPEANGIGPGKVMATRHDKVVTAMRAACLFTSLLCLSIMVTSEQHSTLSIYGFSIPVHSKWSYSESLEFLVGVSVAVAAHSLVQLGFGVRRVLRSSPVLSSRYQTWIILVGDQVLAYAMMSAGSAAAGVSNLNRTGIRHSSLPNFCEPLRRFCNRMAVAITTAFLSFSLLAASAILDVIWLSRN